MTAHDDAMVEPQKYFRLPSEILDQAWTSEQKFQVLRQWKDDLAQLAVATEENMPPADKDDGVTLRQINDAIHRLGYDPAAGAGPSKSG